MNRRDFDAAISGDRDDLLPDVLFDIAWGRTRRTVGLGFDEAPFSLWEETVGADLWAAQMREIDHLAAAVAAARNMAQIQYGRAVKAQA